VKKAWLCYGLSPFPVMNSSHHHHYINQKFPRASDVISVQLVNKEIPYPNSGLVKCSI